MVAYVICIIQHNWTSFKINLFRIVQLPQHSNRTTSGSIGWRVPGRAILDPLVKAQTFIIRVIMRKNPLRSTPMSSSNKLISFKYVKITFFYYYL